MVDCCVMSSNNIAYSCITASPFSYTIPSRHQMPCRPHWWILFLLLLLRWWWWLLLLLLLLLQTPPRSSFISPPPPPRLSLSCVPYVVMFFPSSKSFINSCPFVPCIVLPPPPSNTCHHYSTIMIATTASTYTYLISNSINNRIGTEGGWDINDTGIRLDFGYGVGDCVKYWQA